MSPVLVRGCEIRAAIAQLFLRQGLQEAIAAMEALERGLSAKDLEALAAYDAWVEAGSPRAWAA